MSRSLRFKFERHTLIWKNIYHALIRAWIKLQMCDEPSKWGAYLFRNPIQLRWQNLAWLLMQMYFCLLYIHVRGPIWATGKGVKKKQFFVTFLF